MCLTLTLKYILRILNSYTGDSQLINDMLEGLLNEDKDLEMKLTLKREICLVKRFWETRWTARFDTVSSLLASYKFEHAALAKIENISISDAKTNASGYRCYLEDLESIVAVVLAHYLLSFLKPLTSFLQKSNCNMVNAFEE